MTAPTYRPRKHALALFIIDNGILHRMNIFSAAAVDDENESQSLEGGLCSHDTGSLIIPFHTEPQVFPNQAEACQGPEAEPPCASMDSPPNWQHHPSAREQSNPWLTFLNSYNAKRRHWRKTRIGI
ncbi:hypothetical protein FMUND_80 [Fusarium mundagurra]|uniref:Uncharacterized protein n=1 Tax=Fusarium mundagurra TaxID=1567541 RepID=A0A8H5Z9E4_9HYPO|nr:hypothetical protein FMUND_80 [Fusarium mundagurra]